MTRKAYGVRKDAAQQGARPAPLYLLGGALVLIIVGAFLLLRGPAEPAKAVEVSGKPRLAVDQEKIDVGLQPLGQPVTVAFEISNVGDQPLQLIGVPKVEVREGC